LGREVAHSPPSSAEVKNGGTIPALAPATKAQEELYFHGITVEEHVFGAEGVTIIVIEMNKNHTFLRRECTTLLKYNSEIHSRVNFCVGLSI
jgi:hypothetical protein